MSTLASVSLAASLWAAATPALAQEVYGHPNAPIAGQVRETVIHTKDVEELRYVILRKLTDLYADDMGITVTQAEKDAYIDKQRRSMDQDRQNQARRRDELARKLQAKDISDSERKALSAELEALDDLIANLAEVTAPPAEDPEEVRAAREEIASAYIRQWKLNRALYQDYGGRIIFQQGGPEPLDAYRRFLEERQRKGAFAILNPELEDAFWRYYRNDSIHSFYPPGSEQEAELFRTPWWLSDR